jgi:outer membrane lipoprotein-sorting protein
MKLNPKLYRSLLSIICVFMLVISNLHAQMNLADKISNNYKDAKSFTMDVKCQLDFASSYTGPVFVSTGSIARDGDYYYSNIMGIVSITNDKYQYVMDHGQKIIFVQNKAPLDYSQQFNLPMVSTEKMYEQYDFKFENNKRSIMITIIPKNPGDYKEMKIKVDARKYFLEEVHTYYNAENNQVIASHIYYSNTKFNIKLDKKVFDIEQYIHIKSNKSIVATTGYQDFKVINYLKNEVH